MGALVLFDEGQRSSGEGQVFRILCWAFCLFCASQSLWGEVTGTILGTVRDATGAVVVGAKVTATNTETNLRRQVETDSQGQYRFLALPVGHYDLTAAATGFEQFVTREIVLTVNEQRRVDVSLHVGEIQQKVEVKADAVQVETTNTQLGDVVETKKLLALPLNGRSYIDLLGLQAGVVPETAGSIQQDRPVSGGLSAGNVSVNGQRETANAFLVNGGDVSEGRNLGAAVIPNLDAVAEFRLLTNSFDAEYGRFSGAVMNAITKSGTNGFHGSVFEFLRNDKLDARNFFDPTKGELRRNQFGYAIGGPLLKDKLFWFTDYQGTREVTGQGTGIVQVLSPAERTGDLSATGLTGTVVGAGWAETLSQRLGRTVTAGEPYSQVFPGDRIPQSAFAAPVATYLNYIPQPTIGDNLFASAAEKRRVVDDKFGQRVDLNTQRTGNWFFYYNFDDSTVTNPLPAATVPGFPTVTPSRAQQAVLSNTKTFGPTAVNEARLSFMRTSVHTDLPTKFADLQNLGFVTGAGTLGIVPSGPEGFLPLPQVALSSIGLTVGNPTLSTFQPNNTWHLSDGFSKIWGRHNFKFGGEARYLQINERNICSPTGNFDFDGSETGSDVADFLLGAPVQYTQCSMQFLDSRSHYGGAYGQDSIRLRPNLTLNLGLRWEFSQPWYDTQGKIETIVPGLQSTQFPTAPLGWVVPGDPGIPKTLAPTDYKNLGPRVGIAYSPGFSDGVLGKIFGGPGKTSIRAAYGIYYTAIEDLNLFYEVGDAPFGLYWTSSQPTAFSEPFRSRADNSSQGQRFPFKFPIPGDPANKTLDYSIYLPISYSPGYSIHNRLPYAEHYNFTIQRGFTDTTVLTLAYVGTQGHRLISQYDANPGDPAECLSLMGSGVAPGTLECGPNLESSVFTRPDGTIVNGTRNALGPAFGANNSYTVNLANSNYNSLQVSVERKASDVTFLAAYTFSKALDNSSAFDDWVNFTNYALSRSLSSFDVTHNFVVSYDWAVPFQRMFKGAPRALTNGWELIGITRYATGFPITVHQDGDQSLTGSSNTDVPDRIGNPVTMDAHNAGVNGPNQYFSPDAFVEAPLGRFGNSNRRFFHGPGIANWDFALHKTTRLTEHMGLQIRGEFFNVFNHTQFTGVNGEITSPRFGTVNNARPPRIGQVSAKLIW
ncbi:MAG: carboxypeptidase regulatory-like domain-containing protein [Acidobacteriota bacterium]